MMNLMFYVLYFLLALTAALAATAKPAGVPILDTDGKALDYRRYYYVLPRTPGAVGGGLTLAPHGDKKCPLYVGQEISEVNKGLPAKFANFLSPFRPLVIESYPLTIRIKIKPTNCSDTSYWSVNELENATETEYIAAGRPTFGFQIDKANGNSYQIVFQRMSFKWNNVGIIVEPNGVRRLALTTTPFEVVFKRAPKKVWL